MMTKAMRSCFKTLNFSKYSQVKKVILPKWDYFGTTDFIKSPNVLNDAIENSACEIFSYLQLHVDSDSLFNEYDEYERIGILANSSYDYLLYMWSIWKNQKCAVPLSPKHPLKEIEYFISNSECEAVFLSEEFDNFLEPLKDKLEVDFHTFEPIKSVETLPEDFYNDLEVIEMDFDKNKDALIIYTSGTTGKSKGVVHTFNSLDSQIKNIVNSWGYTQNDVTLNVLPLHHIHGIVNALHSGISCQSKVKLLNFHPRSVWEEFSNCSVFHAVPTVYVNLIRFFETCDDVKKLEYSNYAKGLRLMVSGSAALPTPVFDKWKEITGQTLLERYGMSEIGMCLSNPLNPVEDRKKGFVGKPFENFEVKVKLNENETSGELFVRGSSMFKEYYKMEQETLDSFDEEGYFETGDTVSIDEDGSFRILGRTSIDIIKSCGYKISSLGIERVLLSYESIQECCVFGVEDEYLGEKIVALLVLKEEKEFERVELMKWLKEEIAGYKIPKEFYVVEKIPKNQMGKVNKKEIRKHYE